jgi:Predicted transcriptional regulators
LRYVSKNHWSQTEAADRIGINKATLSRWEQGRSTPSLYNIRLLCDAYQTSSEELGLDASHVIETSTLPADNMSEIQSFIRSDLTMRLMSLAFGGYRDYQALQDKMTTILEEHSTMDKAKALITRREALSRLTTLPILALGLTPNIANSNALRNITPALQQCAAGVAAARELIKSSETCDLALAYNAVTTYLPTLKGIMRESSSHRKEAANIAAQSARIASTIGRLGWHSEGIRQAEEYAQQAVDYAQQADDPAILISSILSQAWAYYYDRRCVDGVNAVARAIPLLKQSGVPKSLAARVLSTQAVLLAKQGRKPDSVESLRKAQAVAMNDDYYACTDTTLTELLGNTGMALYHVSDHGQALDAFAQLIDPSTLASKRPLSGKGRLEMLNFMALSEIKSPARDMDKVLRFWQAGIEGARTLQSKQRINESLAIYDIMEVAWPGERRVIELKELTIV